MSEDFPKVYFEKATIEIKNRDKVSEKAERLGYFVCKYLCKYEEEFKKRPDYKGEFDELIDEACDYCPIMNMLF